MKHTVEWGATLGQADVQINEDLIKLSHGKLMDHTIYRSVTLSLFSPTFILPK